MSVVLQRCSWLSKTCSDSKSRVSEVKNSRNIFTLFSPQSKGPFSKTVRETCHLIRVRLKNNLYLDPRTISFDGEVFYSVWQEMEPPQLVVIHIHKLLHSIGLVPVRSGRTCPANLGVRSCPGETLIRMSSPVEPWCAQKIVLFWPAEQFYEHFMQKLIETRIHIEINKQSEQFR